MRLTAVRRCVRADLCILAFSGVSASSHSALAAQGSPTASTAASQATSGDLLVLDFARSVVGPIASGGQQSGGLPSGAGGAGSSGAAAPSLRIVDGTLDVVDHLGQRMLRASTRATLLLQLPAGSVLPTDFTVEVDLVPKAGGQPEDLAIEGTRTIALGQNAASANLHWHSEAIRAIGGGPDLPDGGPTFDQPMPADLTAAAAGQFTRVVWTFQGDLVTVYTNARLVYALPNRKFVRGGVLRVFLGANPDDAQPVYLARVRVAAGVQPPVAVVASPPSRGGIAGPLVPGQSGPLTAGQAGAVSRAAAFGPPQPRTISLSPVTSAGASGAPAPQTIVLSGFTGNGASGGVPPQRITLAPLSAAGAAALVAARTIALSAVTASGTLVTLAPRSLAGAVALGGNAIPASRTFSLPALQAQGGSAVIAAKTVRLSAFSGTGAASAPASQTITLPTISLSGFQGVPPRTIRLPAVTAVGFP